LIYGKHRSTVIKNKGLNQQSLV